jgi:hypothetical protein
MEAVWARYSESLKGELTPLEYRILKAAVESNNLTAAEAGLNAVSDVPATTKFRRALTKLKTTSLWQQVKEYMEAEDRAVNRSQRHYKVPHRENTVEDFIRRLWDGAAPYIRRNCTPDQFLYVNEVFRHGNPTDILQALNRLKPTPQLNILKMEIYRVSATPVISRDARLRD